MQDQLDLANLVASYAAAVDSRDWEALGTLFVDDAVLVTPDPPRSMTPVIESHGRDEIIAMVSKVAPFLCTMHHLTGSVWTDAGDLVLGRTTGIAHHVENSVQPRSWAWHVVYADAFVRSDAGWRIARRELTVRMIEARPMTQVLPFGSTIATPPAR
jgi:ketosteroid isomerase-like protein